jgi:hypothetical protein
MMVHYIILENILSQLKVLAKYTYNYTLVWEKF